MTIKLSSDKVLYFDIFINTGKLYVIAPLYKRINIDQMNVVVNGERLYFKKIVKNQSQAIQILYQNVVPATEYKISISFRHRRKTFLLLEKKVEKKKLTLTTLFKEDYHLIDKFYDYYTKQGVEHFYLYYNGKITEEIRNSCNKPNITLIQWDFAYWNTKSKFSDHHAQLGQIHDAIYKYGKNYSDYMIFCDLDEYLHVKNSTLIELLEQYKNIDSFGFRNKWSETMNGKIPNEFPKKFISSRKQPFGKRSKCIHRIEPTKYIDIHYGFAKNQKNIYEMFHFYNWTKTDRKRELERKEVIHL